MKHIIFINQVTGPLLIDMVNVFANNNYKVDLYTGEVSKTTIDLDKRVFVKKLTKYQKNNNFLRLSTWILFSIQALIHLYMNKKKRTILYFSSNPPFVPWLNLFFKNTSFIHIYDVYPNALLALPFITKRSLIYKLFLLLNKKAFAKSKKVLTPSMGMKNMLLSSTTDENISVIPWWADTKFIRPIDKKENKFIQKYNLEEKFIVMYSGNFGLTHNIEKILDAAKTLKDRTDIKFIIIGDGPKKNVVKRFEKEFKLDNLIILPFQDEHMLPHSMSASDISVVLDSFSSDRNKESTASIPSKTYYLMSAGSVIYAESDKTSELNALITKNNIGMCDDDQNIEGFVRFILRCKDSEDLLKMYKENSRKTSLNFTQDNAFLLLDEIEEN